MSQGCPRPAAATRGTTVLAEDMFYNVPLRRKALRSASDELSLILDIAGKYAVHHAGAAIVVKRAGEARADLATTMGGSRTDAIRAVYGSAVAKNILPVQVERGNGFQDDAQHEAEAQHTALPSKELRCSIQGFVTGADYAGRRTQLVLFINGRCVEFPPLKRCLEVAYASLLPKAAKPWAFLDIRLPAADVDVNIHPTKKEVAFLYQEELIDAVRLAVEEAMLASNAQRTFTQSLLPGAAPPLLPLDLDPGTSAAAPSYYRPDKLVRTDAKIQTLDAFLGSSRPMASDRPASAHAMQSSSAQLMPAEVQQPRETDHESGTLGMNTPSVDGLQAVQEALRPPSALAVADVQQSGPLAAVEAAAMAAVGMKPRRRHPSDKYMHTPTVATDGDAFLPTPMEFSAIAAAAAQQGQGDLTPATMGQTLQRPVRHRSSSEYASSGLFSVERLLADVEKMVHSGLAEIFRSPTFVGLADSCRALLQAGTRLYLVDLQPITADMFYQQSLRRFGQAPRVIITPPVSVASLALVALEAEEIAGRWEDTAEGGTKEEVADLLQQLLIKKAPLLLECFSIGVSHDGLLECLPQLIEQYKPPSTSLPTFILSLGQSVEWQDEGACFEGIARALGNLYSVCNDPCLDVGWGARGGTGAGTPASTTQLQDSDVVVGSDDCPMEQRREREMARRQREWEVAHVVLPALRLFLRPSRKRALDGSVVELTRLEHLYRVFERC
jgi:DNA mismatch repair protein MLH1